MGMTYLLHHLEIDSFKICPVQYTLICFDLVSVSCTFLHYHMSAFLLLSSKIPDVIELIIVLLFCVIDSLP